MRPINLVLSIGMLSMWFTQYAVANDVLFRGRVVDADSARPLAARVYVESQSHQWFTVESATADGQTVPYQKRRSETSVEIHTSVSAHPFQVKLPPGQYTLTVERGKEYLPCQRVINLKADAVELEIPLRHWVNMSTRGWYSGETHVHRTVDELPTLMLAEDVNVTFPLTYWVTRAGAPPAQGKLNSPDVQPQLIRVDSTHVIYPMNTEYEINLVGAKRHTLGAFFALNHRAVLQQAVPPVTPVAEAVHAQGGLIELDKHNWPWSMMLVPQMKVDLYELANNHMWKAPFFFSQFGEPPAPYMAIEQTARGFTEAGWIDFTFKNYYTLLNCGFQLQPTAGTASGVHPVPLGFGRVYVHLDQPFSYENWVAGLKAGHSFVTTGPLLLARVNGKLPGHTFTPSSADPTYAVAGEVDSARKLTRIEVVVNGRIERSITPTNRPRDAGGFSSRFQESLAVKQSSWIVVRCYAKTADGRLRFAHSAPWHVVLNGQPVRPRPEEVQFLIDRMRQQIKRSEGVLSRAAVDEYRAALHYYQQLLSE